MASRNEHTGDLITSRELSEEGKANVDKIFGTRDFRNKPIKDDNSMKSGFIQGSQTDLKDAVNTVA